MRSRSVPPYLILLAVSAALTACSGNNNETSVATPSAAPSDTAVDEATPPTIARSPVSGEATVFIVEPADGATVSSPVRIVFGVSGVGVAASGTFEENTGHHHLLVDVELPPLDQPIPNDANHLHFGKAQTGTTIELEPGSHTLQLLLADGNHVPHEPPLLSDPVTITVE